MSHIHASQSGPWPVMVAMGLWWFAAPLAQAAPIRPAISHVRPAIGGSVPTASARSGLSTRAFRRLLLGQLPFSARQIRQAKRRYRESQRAATRPVRPVQTASVVLSYQPGPGVPPLRIPVARGYVTSITFVDQRGHAWPVTATYAPKTGLQIQQFPTAPNTVMLNVTGVNPYPRRVGWDAVLAGIDIPVAFVAVSGQPDVDSLAVVRVAGLSPADRKALVTEGGMLRGAGTSFATHTAPLMKALAGLPPAAHAHHLTVPPGAQAWRVAHTIYLRLPSPEALLSPAWSSRARAHGDAVYDFPAIHSVLIMTARGRVRRWPLVWRNRSLADLVSSIPHKTVSKRKKNR